MRMIVLAAALVAALPVASRPEESAGILIDEALAALAMTRADCRFRTDYADRPDSFRLEAADSLLLNPLDTEHYVRGLADRASGAAALEALVRLSASELDLEVPPTCGEDPATAASAGASGSGLADRLVSALGPAVERAREHLERAFSSITPDERAFLIAHAPDLLREEEFDPDRPIEEKEAALAEEEALGVELLEIAGRVDRSEIAAAGLCVAAAVDPLTADIDSWAGPGSGAPDPALDLDPAGGLAGDVRAIVETAHGTLVVGGPGPTHYRRAFAFVVDLGGDDLYEASVGGARPGEVSVVLDAGGDDTYIAGDVAFGSGFLGVGLVVDLGGDDVYRAKSFGLGAGLFGVGLLLDRDGNDLYVGDTCVQGAGAFGVGVLSDEAGNDSYEGALFAQGFGFVGGFGLIADRGGNDRYFAGGRYTDEIRYFDHYLSLSQGFGYGWRPDASGGVGMLVDDAGNDVYISDIFGQGSSYWFAIGGLVDRSGNDEYVSYQYAQGAGTHITVAALVDYEGDDNYVSKGVSQGCGHDLAIGILHDLAGDDNYACHDLSQAAGNANGIGVLLDDGGDDSYSVRDPDNTHGYGNLRRDYGSIGVFIDAGGVDVYTGRGADDTWWSYSSHGIGVDTASNGGAER